MLQFKNLDVVSKRILVISLSISALLLSVSLLFFSVRPANAQTPTFSKSSDDGRRYDAISGTVSSTSTNSSGLATHAYSYLLIWNTQTGTYKYIRGESSTTSEEKFW